jgi:PAS domain S-box-containing protein
MNRFIHNDVVITEKELLREIVSLREKISELESDRRNQKKIVNQYKNIFPKIDKPMLLTDVSGKIIDANKKFQDLLGYSLFDMRRMSIKSITPIDLHENETKILLEDLENNKIINSRRSIYHKINGEKVEVDVEVIAIFDDNNYLDGITRIVKNIA